MKKNIFELLVIIVAALFVQNYKEGFQTIEVISEG